MIFRSRAPLRLGLAGGGTDVSPYSEKFGGYVLNTTIDMFAHCTLEVTNDNIIEFRANDLGQSATYASSDKLEYDGNLDVFKGVYNRIVKDFTHKALSFRLTTYSDAISGSGLGGSSTLVVAILKSFVEWLNLPLGDYDLAHLAYEIERIDVGLAGGKQDQYAATFGGFNFIEFSENDKVIVNPLRVKNWIACELEESMLICYTGRSRDSATIINEQTQNVKDNKTVSLEFMHQLKRDAIDMKEAILIGDIPFFADVLDRSWRNKKQIASSITNAEIDQYYDAAKNSGALAGKVSGAGGGGFMVFVVDPKNKHLVKHALESLGGVVRNIRFTTDGTQGWRIS